MKIRQSELEVMQDIIKISTRYFDCNLYENTRDKEIAEARNICVLMIREFTKTLSFDLIAKEFNRSYSNFITCNRKLTEEMSVDRNLRRNVDELRMLIQANCIYLKKSIKRDTKLDIYNLLNTFKISELKEFKRTLTL